ncbi:phosphoglycolate phosphatase [Nitrincola sp. A-D6]|uniref:HAD family hydrolase n=1 Tax=Nitrincola sp. A-D6 TaxID=1545442 RepID=UPI00051F8F3D|nr:HAD-IA family hydrolase [Nitrincola sp. A-D6]KGK41176.1 phosphoglycolate phosphatase [Nitrincola sp. A-D6]
MTPIQAVLFDLDGTLVDTAPDFHRICNQLLLAEGRPAVDYTQLRLSVSNGGRAVIEEAFGFKDDHPDFERLLEQMLALYEASPAQDSRLFAGFDEMLMWLDEVNIPWGIVTNKPARFTHKLLQQLILDTRCAVTICPDDVSRSKPDPEGLLLACKRINRPPASTLYIGDHLRDIQAGQAAGMRTLAAAFGYLSPDDQPQHWHSDFCIQESTQLLPLLKSLIHPY